MDTGHDADTSGVDSRLGRRRLLLALAAVSPGLAGCGGGGDGDEATPTATTAVDTTTQSTAQPSSTAPSTTAQTTTAPTTAAPSGPDPTDLVAAPSAHVQPTDGFASADWLADTEPDVVRVTNLDPAGEGSLRAAVNAEGRRIVVFEVGGVIDLGGDGIEIGSGELFVAGQTAPSPGITLIRGDLIVDATDAIVQHLRVRPGDDLNGPSDALSAGETSQNVIVDHCSVSWGTDENMSANGSADNRRVTFSNNLIAEGLYNSIHPEGEHSMGTLVMDDASEVAVIGNCYAYNGGRHPRLKGGTSSVVVNNYTFFFEGGIATGGGTPAATLTAIVGNRFDWGPDNYVLLDVSSDQSEIFFEDNQIVYFEDGEQAEYPGTFAEAGVSRADARPLWPEDLTALPAADVRETALQTAGARPAERSPHDERIVGNIESEQSGFVDSQADVGGYPDFDPVERQLDPPAIGDGFGAWLAQHTRAVELGEDPPA